MIATETTERAARVAYEANRERSAAFLNTAIDPWEQIGEELRDDWRAIAKAAIDCIPGSAVEVHYIIGFDTYVIADRGRHHYILLPYDLGRAVDALTCAPEARSAHDGGKHLRPWPPTEEAPK